VGAKGKLHRALVIQGSVVANVFGLAAKEYQVCDIVVRFILINVMNDLGPKQRSANVLCHYKPVFPDISARVAHDVKRIADFNITSGHAFTTGPILIVGFESAIASDSVFL
jgi:hypothetical protein